MAKGNELATAYLALVPSLKGAQKSIEKQLKGINTASAGQSMGEKAASGFGSGFNIKNLAIGAAVTAGLAAGKEFALACVESAAAVSAENSAFEQIMGDYSEQAQAKMEEVADATGVVDTRLTASMTSMTAKFKGLGFGIEEATDLATRGLTLASDAAAFWEKSLQDSQSALNSFINGSYEGGEAIGLFANDTQMAQYAIQQGIVSSTKEWSALDEATKQATRLAYAENMMAMSEATGQAAKEAGQYANVKANLVEKWRQFQAIVGEPIMQNIAIPAMNALSGLIDGMGPKVETLTEKLGVVGDFMADTFGPGIQAACELAAPIVERINGFFDHMGTQVQEVLGPALGFLGEQFTIFMGHVEPWIEPLGNVAELFGNILVGALAGASYALGLAMDAFSFATDVIMDFDAFMNGQPSIIGSAIDGIVAWFQSLPSRVWAWLLDTINRIAAWGSEMIAKGKASASRFVDGVVNFIKTLPGRVSAWAGEMATAGYNMVYGMVSGIYSAGGAVWDAITRVCSNALGAVTSFFGIASPSKVMREMFGYVGEGMALGLEDKAARVVGSMRGVAAATMDAASTAASPSFAAAGGYGGTTIYNITLNADIRDFEGIKTLNDLYDVLARARAINPTRR